MCVCVYTLHLYLALFFWCSLSSISSSSSLPWMALSSGSAPWLDTCHLIKASKQQWSTLKHFFQTFPKTNTMYKKNLHKKSTRHRMYSLCMKYLTLNTDSLFNDTSSNCGQMTYHRWKATVPLLLRLPCQVWDDRDTWTGLAAAMLIDHANCSHLDLSSITDELYQLAEMYCILH